MRAVSSVLGVCCLAVLTACSGQAADPASHLPPRPAPAAIAAPAQPMVGVYEPGVPSYARITQFAKATSVNPRVVLYYSGWGENFQAGFAADAWSHGAYTFVQLEPFNATMASVAAGKSDWYLQKFADQVRAFRHPVLLSFAHEMNGSWYPWGYGHVTAAEFVAAWRHVVQVFRNRGADNVTWVWTVNAINLGSPPLKEWWPGSQYVNWVGIDGYYYTQSNTFANVFGSTISEIQTFTEDPMLIGETAIGPGPEAASQVTGLFMGAQADHFAGVVWFDKAQDNPPYHLDWLLEDDPAALAAFRAAVKEYG